MSKAPEVRLAVVGCGLMGRRHSAVIRATEGARLVAVQDRHFQAAQEVAGTDAFATDDFSALLSVRDLDAVVLCLPSGLHANFGIQAARAGKHVIVEKPIDTDPAAARRLAAECESAGVVCAEIKQNRFSSGLSAVKLAVDRGDLGKIVLARASVKWFRHDPYYTESDWRGRIDGEGGGVLINQAVHAVDVLHWLFGAPTALSSMIEFNRRPAMETEDTAVALFQFPGGVLATLEGTTSGYPGFDERYEIQGLRGSCHLEKGRIVFWKQADDLPVPEAPPFPPATGGLDEKLVLFQRQYWNILAAIRGEALLAVSPREAIAVVETIRALYDSAAQDSYT